MFENALKNGFRYPSNKGLITTEDLFCLSLNDLNEIAKKINKLIKDSEEESFIPGPNFNNNNDSKRLDIVKHIINVKINEQNAKMTEKLNAEKRQRIMEVIKKKDEESLENMSKEELEKLLSNIN